MGIDPSVRASLEGTFAHAVAESDREREKAKPWTDTLLSLIPRNPLAAAVDALQGEMLALMVFAVFFGVALAQVRREREAIVDVFGGVQRVSMKIVDWAMALAPFGVAALMFSLTAKSGFAVIPRLGGYVAVVVAGLAFQQFVVYSAVLKWLARVPPIEWAFRIREVALTAFSTASSNATLPSSLQTAEHKLGIAPRIGNFVLTVGATGNQNGTALFEGVTVLFLAQVFGVTLSLPQQVTVVLMSILAGVGTAGVPGGSIPLIVIVLQSVGIPPEGIGIILGVDRFLDMCRTTLNVTGDSFAPPSSPARRTSCGSTLRAWKPPPRRTERARARPCRRASGRGGFPIAHTRNLASEAEAGRDRGRDAAEPLATFGRDALGRHARGRDGEHRERHVFRALLGLDFESAVGKREIRVSASAEGVEKLATKTLEVRSGRFPTQSLKVEPAYVEPPERSSSGSEDREKVDRSGRRRTRAALESAFRNPVASSSRAASAPARLQRRAALPHNGVDLAAPEGEPDVAPAPAVVALAEDLYFSGGTVILDHGNGLFTTYFHLSAIDVRTGAAVAGGRRIGAVGATGRVTGPHLHWGARFIAPGSTRSVF